MFLLEQPGTVAFIKSYSNRRKLHILGDYFQLCIWSIQQYLPPGQCWYYRGLTQVNYCTMFQYTVVSLVMLVFSWSFDDNKKNISPDLTPPDLSLFLLSLSLICKLSVLYVLWFLPKIALGVNVKHLLMCVCLSVLLNHIKSA